MALFKIEKGLKDKLSVNRPNAVEGYCYFTTDDGKFYIDIADGTANVGTNRICLNAEKATTLETKRNINGVYFDGSADVNNYAECTTAAATKAKQITISNFVLGKGSRVFVKFTYANTAASPTLEVSSDGSFGKNAKPIKVYGNTNMGVGTNTDSWAAGAIVPFTYDGTNWIRDYWYNTIQEIPEQKKYIPTAYLSAEAGLMITSNEFPISADIHSGQNFPFIFFLEEQASITDAILVRLEANDNAYTLGPLRIDGQDPANYNCVLEPGLYYAWCSYQEYVCISFQQNYMPWNVITSYSAVKASGLETNSQTIGSPINPVYFDSNGEPQVCTSFANYLPLSAGANSPIIGPLGLTSGKNYGDSLPSTGFTGEIFFVKEEEKPSLPVGGTEGQYLVKNSSTDGDASWKTLTLPSLDYLPLSGGTLTGTVTGTKIYATNEIGISNSNNNMLYLWADPVMDDMGMSYQAGASTYCIFSIDSTNNKGKFQTPTNFIDTTDSTSTTTGAVTIAGGLGVAKNIYGSKVYGAVWNDYAEYRISDCLEAGRVVCENGDDTLSISNERLQPGANIVSDTFGFAIGETIDAKCPIAVSGRVLAYTYEPRDEFKPGEAVCAGPNGTVSRMTREEIKEYPERIIGTVSAIPPYEYWGENNVAVNGRIWIKVK